MTASPTELYHPRIVSNHGIWKVGSLQFKAYSILADGKALSEQAISKTKWFLDNEVTARIAEMGESNELGFVIIHLGELGITISAHWWVQGSVLCQHIYRQVYGSSKPIDSSTRPVIGCVWELALINAEQEAWREHMMKNTPDQAAYLNSRPAFDRV